MFIAHDLIKPFIPKPIVIGGKVSPVPIEIGQKISSPIDIGQKIKMIGGAPSSLPAYVFPSMEARNEAIQLYKEGKQWRHLLGKN